MDDLPLKYSENGGFPIDHSDEPIRLFKSDFLEFFTHITPQVVVIIWSPVIIVTLARAVLANDRLGTLKAIPLGFLMGIVLWTFAEYTMHRYLFHYHPKNDRMKRIVFLFHGIHHAQPQCKTRLVMPPAVSIPMAFLFYGIFYLVLGEWLHIPGLVDAVMAGFISGYLAYDLIHYATHHARMRAPIWRYLKRNHMRHHFKTPDRRFGVSSPLWDIVFGTLPD
jgi:sterol desaturase/sphingolipid hydroxylase (fatty acid hydroxylase superfamily)